MFHLCEQAISEERIYLVIPLEKIAIIYNIQILNVLFIELRIEV
jgi:hypothetical protein